MKMQHYRLIAIAVVTLGALTVLPAHAQSAKVTGTVSYLERIALPDTAVVTVRLADVSRADAPATIIAEQTIKTGGAQPPYAFELAYDPAAIDDRFTYAVQARIEVDGQLQFITTESYPVITRGNPTQIDVIVRRSSGGSGDSGAITPITTLPVEPTTAQPTLPRTGEANALLPMLLGALALLAGGLAVRARARWA